MAKRAKKLTLDLLAKKAKELEKKERLVLDKEENIVIDYYPLFSKSKIDEVIIELGQTMNYALENNKAFPTTFEDLLKYTMFLTIKHFTDYKEALDGQSYEVHIAASSEMYDRGYWNLIINEAFSDEEVAKVFDAFYEAIESGEKLIKLDKETRNELSDKLQNDFLKDRLMTNQNA